jgi:alanyl-tRNA synthetase
MGTMESGTTKGGAEVWAEVDKSRRAATVLNHSATHLLHAALRQVLGTHVAQKGSLVAPDRLRFDFSHYEPVTRAQLDEIEQWVNEQIRLNATAETALMQYDEAVESGATALFGEKYADQVRVLKLGAFSTELCGGTHVHQAGDIGLCKITAETGIAAGIRRIEAVTGRTALERCSEAEQVLDRVAEMIKGNRKDIETKVRQLLERSRTQEKEIDQLRSRLARSSGDDLAGNAVEVDGIQVLASRLEDGFDAKALREAVDRMKDKLGTAAIVLGAATSDGGVRLAAGVTKDIMDRVKAGDLVNSVAERVGGKGGGRPDFAQAGGSDAKALNAALEAVPDWIKDQIR